MKNNNEVFIIVTQGDANILSIFLGHLKARRKAQEYLCRFTENASSLLIFVFVTAQLTHLMNCTTGVAPQIVTCFFKTFV